MFAEFMDAAAAEVGAGAGRHVKQLVFDPVSKQDVPVDRNQLAAMIREERRYAQNAKEAVKSPADSAIGVVVGIVSAVLTGATVFKLMSR
jgi:hypothetical protein